MSGISKSLTACSKIDHEISHPDGPTDVGALRMKVKQKRLTSANKKVMLSLFIDWKSRNRDSIRDNIFFKNVQSGCEKSTEKWSEAVLSLRFLSDSEAVNSSQVPRTAPLATPSLPTCQWIL